MNVLVYTILNVYLHKIFFCITLTNILFSILSHKTRKN